MPFCGLLCTCHGHAILRLQDDFDFDGRLQSGISVHVPRWANLSLAILQSELRYELRSLAHGQVYLDAREDGVHLQIEDNDQLHGSDEEEN